MEEFSLFTLFRKVEWYASMTNIKTYFNSFNI